MQTCACEMARRLRRDERGKGRRRGAAQEKSAQARSGEAAKAMPQGNEKVGREISERVARPIRLVHLTRPARPANASRLTGVLEVR